MLSKRAIINLQVEKLLLFGSSLNAPGNDIDIIVISNDFNGLTKKTRVEKVRLNFLNINLDPQCYTVKEFDRLKAVSSFLNPILKDAKEIYD